MREVLARIRAVLRRSQTEYITQGSDETLRAYRFAGWELNVRLHRLQSPDNRRIEISRGEFSLLCAFLSSPQRILTRDQLLDLSRMHSTEVYDRTIDVQVMRLRRKIERDPAHPMFIKTERGRGLCLRRACQNRPWCKRRSGSHAPARHRLPMRTSRVRCKSTRPAPRRGH